VGWLDWPGKEAQESHLGIIFIIIIIFLSVAEVVWAITVPSFSQSPLATPSSVAPPHPCLMDLVNAIKK